MSTPTLSTPPADTTRNANRWGWMIAGGLLLLCLAYALIAPGHRFGAVMSVAGLAVMLGFAVLLSNHKRQIQGRIVAWGLGLQLLFATLVLRVSWTAEAFAWLARQIETLLNYSFAGSQFVFGALGASNTQGLALLGAQGPVQLGVVFAFQVLPTIIFIAALMAILYYIGLMPLIVRAFARFMTWIMGASGAESLNVAASIFMGQTEAPLTIRPYLDQLTESELFTVMTSGMAHVSGSIMAAYVLIGHVQIKHLLTAVIMTAPATIMLAKIIRPEIGQPATAGNINLPIENPDVNVIDAASRGAGEGLHLALNVGAMLIAFIALIALADGLLAHFHTSLENLLGYGFSPIAFLLGVPWKDAHTVGSLLGMRMVVNEFVAYAKLGTLRAAISHRAFVITTFALCGFANFSSIGIQIGGIGALAPRRKHDLARLGLLAMLAGTIANFMSAAIAGLLLR